MNDKGYFLWHDHEKLYFPCCLLFNACFPDLLSPFTCGRFVIKHPLFEVMERLVAFTQSPSHSACSSCGLREDKSCRKKLDNCSKHIVFTHCFHPRAFRDSPACADIQYELYTCSFLIKGKRDFRDLLNTTAPSVIIAVRGKATISPSQQSLVGG